MRVFLLSLLFALATFGCSPKATTATPAEGVGKPQPGLVGPPPAPASAPTPASARQKKRVATHAVNRLAPTAADTTLLWSITARGVAEPSYLFGTIHLIADEDYFLPNRVVAALNDSKRVVFEIDPDEMKNPAMMMRLLGRINMRNDTTLADLLPPEQFAEVEAYFHDRELPFFLLKNMKPLFLSAMVGQDADVFGGMGGPTPGGGIGTPGMKSYELELSELAAAAGKETDGLESIDFQLSLFDSIPYSAQAAMLYDAVRADSAGKDSEAGNQPDAMVAVYRRQAVAELADLITSEAEGVARFEELLLTKRNENWVPVIKAATEAGATGSSFYAVGAGHLGGENGVIALLRAAGLKVEPVY